ncbi:alpha-L-iduronidase-like isoform X1 [Dysidea avara]|uniref:alpha-L-iduronidase-like isoform X1 n=1 Tax=Dysidea avara TaxID=196820 RepID=UPI0033240A28
MSTGRRKYLITLTILMVTLYGVLQVKKHHKESRYGDQLTTSRISWSQRITQLQMGSFISQQVVEMVPDSEERNNETSTDSTSQYNFTVIVGDKLKSDSLKHFWRSTGFCPPLPHKNFSTYFFDDSEVQNLAHFGSVPNEGIKQVRIHWLLDLVTANVVGPGSLVYDFTNLDHAMDLLKENGLKPGFEIMGNPSNIFTDMENKTQVYMWRDLVKNIATRYVDRYGLNYVSEWNFESWNEPNNRKFDMLKFTTQGYLNYYDACSEGLRDAHPSLRLGTPANGPCYKPKTICWQLLQHCVNGTNYFTGEKGVRIDYVSFHMKGRGLSRVISKLELNQYNILAQQFPTLKDLPFYNDEGDPLSGWAIGKEWRADVRYAAVVVKIIAQHINMLIPQNPGLKYQLLTNDNGFLNFGPPHYFDQRTLTTRFLMNLTKPKSVQLVRKPVLSVMGLLSLLGSKQLTVTVLKGKHVLFPDNDVGVIATLLNKPGDLTEYGEVAVMIYNSNDTSDLNSSNIHCHLKWNDLPDLGKDALMMQYRLDNNRTNPYDIWLTAGKPDYPSYQLLQQMRDAIESVQLSNAKAYSPSGGLTISLPLPSVFLLHACAKPAKPPSQVVDVRVKMIVPEQVMIVWKDVPERCLLTYNIVTSTQPNGTYTLVNTVHVHFSLYVHWIKDTTSNPVYYKVNAIDYWGRSGDYSDVACIQC